MGQRHQIFISIPNPLKYMVFSNKAEKDKAIAELGTGKTTILSFHNQWLYGRSAVQHCLNLLNFANNFTQKDLLGKGKGLYDVPFSIDYFRARKISVEQIAEKIAFIMNYRPVNTDWLGAGIGGTFYLEDNELRENFTQGDNNDGITIIDVINKKYCFMNIYKKSREKSFDVSDLPKLKPVDALTYVRAYYGETIKNTNPYHLVDENKEAQEKYVKTEIGYNIEATSGFEKFKVLTLEEIDVMFPNMFLVKKGETRLIKL